MPKVTKNKIVFDGEDWLSDVDYLSTSSLYQRGTNHLSLADSFDPVRDYGYAQPGFLPEDASNVALVTARLTCGIKTAVQQAYVGSADGKVHELSSLSTVPSVSNNAPFPHTIAGANPIVRDMARYFVGVTPPVPYVFYSYVTNTFWDVGTYDFAGTFADTFMSTTPATPLANPDRQDGALYSHPMVVGDSGFLYIGDRNYVHSYDASRGANGTFFSRVLTLPVGYIITAIVNYQFYLVVFAYREGTFTNYLSESKAFFWDTFSSSYLYSKDLSLNSVTEAINYRDTLICFGYGNSEGFYPTVGTMQIFDGSNFRILKKGVDIPDHNGAQVVGENIFWNGQGKVMAYRGLGDRKNFHEIYTDTNTDSGILRFFSNFYNPCISTGAGAGAGLKTLRNSYNTTALVATKVVEPEFPEYMKGKLKSITVVYQKPVSGGRELKLEYFADANAITLFSGKTTVDKLIERYEYNADGTNVNSVGFKQIQLKLTWGAGAGSTVAPAVSRVEMEYESISIE